MSTFALVHGGGGSGWDWHLVAAELRDRGHGAVAVDLPIEDRLAGWGEYADTVVHALGNRRDVVVVGDHPRRPSVLSPRRLVGQRPDTGTRCRMPSRPPSGTRAARITDTPLAPPWPSSVQRSMRRLGRTFHNDHTNMPLIAWTRQRCVFVHECDARDGCQQDALFGVDRLLGSALATASDAG